MIKTITFILICINFLLGILIPTDSILAQTREQSAADTSRKMAQKLQPKEDEPQLELPDVIIYGNDRSIRMTGEKLDRPQEDKKLMAPLINYQPLTTSLAAETEKNYFRPDKRTTGSRSALQLDAGGYQQLDFLIGRWREAENYNYSFKADYSRSSGQYENSQYNQTQFDAQAGIRVSPNWQISSKGTFHVVDYGLYGAQLKDLKRRTGGGKIKIDALGSGKTDHSTEFSIHFGQNVYKDRDENNYDSNLAEKNIGLEVTFHTTYGTLPINIQGWYEYNKLHHRDMSLSYSQKYTQLKSWSSLTIKQQVAIRPSLLLENLELSESFSRGRFSPELEIVVLPVPGVGFLFKAASGYFPISYSGRWRTNYYISQQSNFVPMTKELEVKLGIEYQPTTKVILNTEFLYQNWNNYGYWLRATDTGLYEVNALAKVTLTSIAFQAKYTLSASLKFDAGLQINVNSVEDDSLAKNKAHLPYLEKLKFPIHIEYKLGETTRAWLTFLWIGPRYVNLMGEQQLSKFAMVSLEVEWQLHKNISFFTSGNNLLNQDYAYWQNYDGLGTYFVAGIKGNW